MPSNVLHRKEGPVTISSCNLFLISSILCWDWDRNPWNTMKTGKLVRRNKTFRAWKSSKLEAAFRNSGQWKAIPDFMKNFSKNNPVSRWVSAYFISIIAYVMMKDDECLIGPEISLCESILQGSQALNALHNTPQIAVHPAYPKALAVCCSQPDQPRSTQPQGLSFSKVSHLSSLAVAPRGRKITCLRIKIIA